MAAIAREPAPTPARTLLAALRARSARNAISSLRVAWHLGTIRTLTIAPAARVRSIALVLGVACVLGTGSLAAAATLGVVADPVARFFQSQVDVQGPIEHQSSESTGNPATGTPRPGVKGPPNNDNVGHNGPSATDQPGRGNGDGGHGAPTATDRPGGNNGVHKGPSGSDQPGGHDGGRSGPG